MSEIVFNFPSPSPSPLNPQVENFQTTLASLNQQVIILQEALQERDQEIANLKTKLASWEFSSEDNQSEVKSDVDETLTIVGILINLYKLIFLPGKVV